MDVLLPSRVDIASDVLFQELEGEVVLLNLESERYYGLNDSGSRIWQLLSEKGDVNAAYEQILREYKVEPEELRRDMAQLISKLANAGLLRVDSTAARNGTR